MDNDILAIQQYYPRIYLACHTEHIRSKSSITQLSARDSSILAHLSVDNYISPTRLARHLNISKATLSEALAKLIELGYVASSVDEEDARRQKLKLSTKGIQALSASSILDSSKLKRLLQQLDDQQRQYAIKGLALLAMAAGKLSE